MTLLPKAKTGQERKKIDTLISHMNVKNLKILANQIQQYIVFKRSWNTPKTDTMFCVNYTSIKIKKIMTWLSLFQTSKGSLTMNILYHINKLREKIKLQDYNRESI